MLSKPVPTLPEEDLVLQSLRQQMGSQPIRLIKRRKDNRQQQASTSTPLPDHGNLLETRNGQQSIHKCQTQQCQVSHNQHSAVQLVCQEIKQQRNPQSKHHSASYRFFVTTMFFSKKNR
jgi:hypothetical protein